MTKTARGILLGLCIALTFTLLATAQQQMPRTTKESVPGTPTVKTEQLSGTVILVEGNHLAVRMSTGAVRTFDVPESRRFIIDGKELTVRELKPGTKLAATVTTTTTPVTDRTTTVGTGKVWFVSGNTVILTLPNNENRQYTVNDNYRFIVDGQKASVHELRKGMIISAQKIVEEPRTEMASNVAVTGQAPPPPRPTVAEVPAPSPAPVARTKPAPLPPAAAPAPPAQEAERAAEPTSPPELPSTASEFPLIGFLGLLSVGTSVLVRRMRRL